ncbi:MAG: tripartite tricarboxylate transporter substrate-binding protein [Pseudomonadota bacterium]|nr:tripartite tricarboxylate transporter substrate-binding protein [Pseudomonadota bacterium]
MIFNTKLACIGAVGIAALMFTACETSAQFYKGKKLDMYSAGGSKGSYNRHLRLMEKFLTKHIPGNPEIAINPMPGAGGLKAANYLYNAAAKDGTAAGTLLKTIGLNEAIGRRGVKYKTAKFTWLVSSGPIDSVLALWKSTSPAKTVEDVFKKKVILGSTGKGSPTFIEPTIMNATIGTKFKIITGYKGLGKVHLAVERGEVQGRFASWEAIKCCKKAWLKENKVAILMQSGLVRNKDLPKVKSVWEFAKNESDRDFLKFIAAGSTLGRIYLAPPGIPKAAAKALRKGFWDALHDPEYVALTKKRGMGLTPMSYKKAKDLALSIMKAKPAVIKRAKKYLLRKKKKK